MDEAVFMRRALDLAARAGACVMPNPKVGAVLVRDGRLIGEGFHARFGGPHAEIEAIRSTSEPPCGATLYVTLEPCNATGKTPPCVDAILAAGVGEVVFAVPDPNPAMRGGSQRLEEAGVRVRAGILEAESRLLLAPFLKHVRSGLPLVHAKWAMSLDGRVATRTGESKWITDEEARADAHALRGEVGAILSGVETVLVDDPLLTCRIDGGHSPLRVILDSWARLPESCRLLQTLDAAGVLVATTPSAPASRVAALRQAGAEVVTFPSTGPRVPLEPLLHHLGARGLNHILVEGGPTLLGSFLDGRLIDRARIYIGASLIGGAGALGPIAGTGVAVLAEGLKALHSSLRPAGTGFAIDAILSPAGAGV